MKSLIKDYCADGLNHIKVLLTHDDGRYIATIKKEKVEKLDGCYSVEEYAFTRVNLHIESGRYSSSRFARLESELKKTASELTRLYELNADKSSFFNAIKGVK